MKAPKPVLNTSENEELEMKSVKIFEFRLKNELNKLEFGKSINNSSIIFRLINNSSLIKKYYLLNLNIEELYNLNPIFKFYKDINEIYDILIQIFNDKNFSIISKENQIFLILKFNMPGKIIDIEFNLKEKIIKNEKLIENAYDIINKLIKENESMKNELNIVKQEFEKVNNENKIEINKIKNENSQLKERLKKIEDLLLNKVENIKENNIFNDSSIIKDEQDKKLLNLWISEKGNIEKLILLYRGTKDGDTSNKFFEKCSNKGSTISFIKTKKGRRFGGFTKTEWTDKNKWITLKDENAFLFSLDNKKKYDIKKPEFAMRCIPYNYCLVYGNDGHGEGLRIPSGFLKSDNWENNSKKVYDLPSDNCLSGEQTFSIEDLEVYQIIFKT